VEALRRAGPTPTRESLIKAMAGLDRFDTGGFVVDFASHGRSGSDYIELTMISKDGKFIR